MWSALTSLLITSTLALRALAETWSIDATYIGQDFLNAWSFENITDPTGGRVTYVDQATALADNLTYVTDDTLIMRCDYTTVLTSDDPGRNSVRIKSNAQYNYHVTVHMPQGCATWPAAWETNDSDWPTAGEVDVVSARVLHGTPYATNKYTLSNLLDDAMLIEGVNSVTPNTISLHVGSTCAMPDSLNETGTPGSTDCDTYTDNNSGCSVQNPTDNSFGPDFNEAGGGWYAMERTADWVNVWFWTRDATDVPSDVSSGADSIDTSNWGTPIAYFPNTDCDIDSVFAANNIIFDLTLCGDWAGVASIYEAAGCSGTCDDFVNENPSAFSEAYWDVASVLVYT
ncbi:glycoside hydrolase family 16 protein [Laetiporus sulphureus 93-53]|uniref:Glycoside hydrolase family 16 protein n=1 Tax=Laetiporus sulphureus 93-53 TaxID=1314785 RepID=A0A165E4S8_9APHY|nr:glycoside hydrolase family 16 protein [Laetiporus sulphureus 93-53]KZT06239.1 glycoside hydrolase family 16 protein [Laetiporus sulphureus 93-53]